MVGNLKPALSWNSTTLFVQAFLKIICPGHPDIMEHFKSFVCHLFVCMGILMSLLLCGCHSGASQEGRVVAAFKQDVHETMQRMSLLLSEPLAREDFTTVKGILAQICEKKPNSIWKPVTCHMGVLSTEGKTVASSMWDVNDKTVLDYSRYESFSSALSSRKTVQIRLYSQGDTPRYAILTPLRHNGHVIGFIGLWFDARSLHQNKGISEEMFMALNFDGT